MADLEEIAGEFVTLVPPSPDQWADHLEYLNDPVTMEHLGNIGSGPGSWTKETSMARLERWAMLNEKGDTRMYSLRCQGRFVGHGGFMELRGRCPAGAEYGIIVGRRTWGGPVAPEATLLLLDLAFDQLDLHRVWFVTSPANMRMRSVLSRFCQLEGTLRHNVRLADGTYHDSVQYSLLAPEWPRGRQVLERMVRQRAG